MKKSHRPVKWTRYILPTLLLAVACIGAVELWVCSFQAPAIYETITAPVRAAAQQVYEVVGPAGERFWTALRQKTDEALSSGVAQVQAGLRRLDDYFSSSPDTNSSDASSSEPEDDPFLEEDQLVDEQAVTPPPRSRAEYYVTAMASRNGKTYLTGGSWELTYFNQTSSLWAEKPYGSDTIGPYGCGPTAMAMVVSTLSGDTIDPVQMSKHCVDHGYWAKKHGSYWSIVPGAAEDFGLTCTSLPPEETDKDTIIHHLSTGELLVAMMGPGHFTNGGHFIVLRGITLDGSVLVADPASSDRSLTTWDLDLILEELSPNRSSGGPLWAVSSLGS